MLSLDYIKRNTKWVAKLNSGRIIGTYDEIKQYQKEARDFDILYSGGQPKELQEFYKAYEYVTFYMNRYDLYDIDTFYKEWSKNPELYQPKKQKVITTLSKVLENYLENTNIVIINYDKVTLGNHYLNRWISAIEILDKDYDVINIEEINHNTITIRIQTDSDSANELSWKANSMAINY